MIMKKIIIYCILSLLCIPFGYSHIENKAPIVIISSYNPDAASTTAYLSNFINEYKSKENNRNIIIENMNCKALSESPKWNQMMRVILRKYSNILPNPALMILLGQEAITAYLSQPSQSLPHIPVMVAMGSRCSLKFPNHMFNPATLDLPSIDLVKFAKPYNIVGGYLYQYDLDKNIELIKKLYPNTKKIAFLSDNSCGGICLLSFVKKEMKKHPGLEFISLDGRQYTVYSMINEINKLRDKTVLLLGTWRMDKNEGFFLHNSVYLMKDVNPKLPVFSISTIGVGEWAIGGYTPNYRNTGNELANDAYKYITNPGHADIDIKMIPQKYIFDANSLKLYNINNNELPKDSSIINQPESFWMKNKNVLIIASIAFFILLIIILFLTFYLIRINKLKNALLSSQKQLVSAKERAEEATKLEKAFVANMSHEIRTPLNAIVGFTNLLTTTELPEDQKQEFKVIIQQNSDLLLNLINDILDLSRLEVNYLPFKFATEDIIGICKSVLITTKAARSSQLEYKFESSLKECHQLVDMKRLQQVLINLLTNADKFTEKGSITLCFELNEKDKRMEFAVKDTGKGIPADKRETIFERFTKLDNFVQGTGLGLSICKITIEKIGGKIWVDPDYTEGACFRFYAPIRSESDTTSIN